MFLLGILLFSLSISIHELGHAIAMRRYGIQLDEVCLFGFGPKLFTFRWKKLFGETPVTIRLIPLGAFVRPSEIGTKRISRMSYSKSGHILGGGIVANILFGAILFLTGFIISGGEITINHLSATWMIVTITVLFLIGAFPRFSFYLVLPLGFFLLFVLTNSLLPAIADLVSGPATSKSPVGSIVSIVQSIQQHTKSLADTFIYAGFLSVSVGLFNALPFYPLDGGQILVNLAEKIFPSKRRFVRPAMQLLTALPLITLAFWAIKGDVFKIINAMV